MKLTHQDKQDILRVFNNQEYNEENKETWIRVGRKLAKMIVQEMGLQKDQFKINVNRAGPAVGADISVYTPNVFISLSPSSLRPYWFMWRTCERLGDCGAGMNHHNRWASLDDVIYSEKSFSEFVSQLKSSKLGYE